MYVPSLLDLRRYAMLCRAMQYKCNENVADPINPMIHVCYAMLKSQEGRNRRYADVDAFVGIVTVNQMVV